MFTAGSIYVFKLENPEQACAVPLSYLLGSGSGLIETIYVHG